MTQDSPEKVRKGVWKYINMNMLGVLFLVAALTASVMRVMSIRKKLFDPNKTIMHIQHWQLELGYRNALQAVIDRYVKMRKDLYGEEIEIYQLPVTERVYAQLLNTHLISGTAPDIAELGMAKLSKEEQYLAQYFQSLVKHVIIPNPYNDPKYWPELSEADQKKLLKLKPFPWRETFIDGMQCCYKEGMQDYFGVPTSMFTNRLFYNKDILTKAGYPDGPKTLQELFDACQEIKTMKDKKGKPLIPIAGSKYSLEHGFKKRYSVAFTASFEPQLDLDLGGTINDTEAYIGFLNKIVTMETPAIKAQYECMLDICNQFSPGFMGMDRMQSGFDFVMGRAGMIASGSWDAMSMFKQAQFEVGVVDFPLPVKPERWSEFVLGRCNEAKSGGGTVYGVYKFGKNKELALDFLRYLTSQPGNQLLNQKADWLPVILGALPSQRMLAFVPDPKGYMSEVKFEFSCNYIKTVVLGLEGRYFQGEISYKDFAKGISDALMNEHRGGDYAWADDYKSNWRKSRDLERVMAVQLVRDMMDPEDTDARENYRRILVQQIRNNNGQSTRYQFEQVRGRKIPEF
jgi:raffinose/stachyose/melibiose transport system substrate-binding protein